MVIPSVQPPPVVTLRKLDPMTLPCTAAMLLLPTPVAGRMPCSPAPFATLGTAGFDADQGTELGMAGGGPCGDKSEGGGGRGWVMCRGCSGGRGPGGGPRGRPCPGRPPGATRPSRGRGGGGGAERAVAPPPAPLPAPPLPPPPATMPAATAEPTPPRP